VKVLVSSSGRSNAPIWFRWSVLTGGVMTIVVALLGFLRFPEITGSATPYAGLAVVAVVLVGVPSGITLLTLRSRNPTTLQAPVTPRLALALGALVGLVWIVYILLTHLALSDAQKPTVGAALTWVTLGITAVAMLAVSAWGTNTTRRFSTAVAIGLGGGVVAGLLAQLTVIIMLDSAMGFLVQHMNAGEVRAFAQSGWSNRESWYFWNEEFVGSISYFALLVVGGVMLGVFGGVIGRLLAAFSRPVSKRV
jgi:hypothetical protein